MPFKNNTAYRFGGKPSGYGDYDLTGSAQEELDVTLPHSAPLLQLPAFIRYSSSSANVEPKTNIRIITRHSSRQITSKKELKFRRNKNRLRNGAR